ncbi:uncharacterized, partial [Tachysurus ichikawai]
TCNTAMDLSLIRQARQLEPALAIYFPFCAHFTVERHSERQRRGYKGEKTEEERVYETGTASRSFRSFVRSIKATSSSS